MLPSIAPLVKQQRDIKLIFYVLYRQIFHSGLNNSQSVNCSESISNQITSLDFLFGCVSNLLCLPHLLYVYFYFCKIAAHFDCIWIKQKLRKKTRKNVGLRRKRRFHVWRRGGLWAGECAIDIGCNINCVRSLIQTIDLSILLFTWY